MAKLIEAIRRAGYVLEPAALLDPEWRKAWQDRTTGIMEMLRTDGLPVFVVDNVADYYYFGTDQEYFDLDKDFPNVAPPFINFWMEYHIPSQIRSKDYGINKLPLQMGRAGALFNTISVEYLLEKKMIDAENIRLPNAHWGLLVTPIFQWMKDGDVEGPGCHMLMLLDKQGQIIEQPKITTYTNFDKFTPDQRMMANELIQGAANFTKPLLLALCFLHCKNVQVTDTKPPEKLVKKWVKRGGYPPVTYKTLEITPMREILAKASQTGGGKKGEGGWTRALHIVRGHFKDYREGHGLFGKYQGMFWWDSVVKGKKDKGEVKKEYEVKV